ncbi:hypothetical protein GGI25_006276 [Coemansia spiralis]|uniref:SS18 N-terminal domain-containing protein n=2 Tax=Coemansia TaxID=4863 RepID=A0A9W8G324_9FUNG|nr:hypothetical protein BX070DRAFT_233630 [Coemansia spiralis]KAJ1986588.1 hypothetical protein EDC05_006234 [Coemansia umbellata]KAJ2618807.1 hypothetical protein GGI26_006334 [Coemansia sp. RSA 1358]KAJ2669040.1 hypothetical protein GGI25_006276 [Coemansia spiralis]
MDNRANSEIGQESDIDVILEDDSSEQSDNAETGLNEQESNDRDESVGGNQNKRGEREREGTSRRIGNTDDEPSTPYLPRLKTSIIQMVLNINAELLKLCKEYQNNSLMDDPQLIVYQMRLQSNLAYLASIADHYLDPTRSMPDFGPLPKPELPSCQGSTISAKLAHARKVYTIYANAWVDQQKELSRRAKSRIREEEKAIFANKDRENLHEHVEQLLKKDRVICDNAADEPIDPETYKPFPPFKISKEMQLPPGLQRWSFENNVAVPDDSAQ